MARMGGGSTFTDDESAGYQRAVERLEKTSIDVDIPPEESVFFRPQQLATGDTEAEYMSGTDSIVVYADDTTLYPAALSHEIIHYTQVHRALGDPSPAFSAAVDALQSAAEEAAPLLNDASSDVNPDARMHIATNSDVNTVGAVYAFDADIRTVYDGDMTDAELESAIKQHPQYDRELHSAVMEPIQRRAEQVDALPLDTVGEADALFWSLYEWCRRLSEEVSADDLYRDLHGWNNQDAADSPPRADIASRLPHYDTDDNTARSTGILDGIEQRIQEYNRHRQEGCSSDTAAGRVMNRHLNQFDDLGPLPADNDGPHNR